MKFSKNNSLKIILIGAGGTGGYIAPHLYNEHDSCCEGSNGCGGDFHQCPADRGKFSQR